MTAHSLFHACTCAALASDLLPAGVERYGTSCPLTLSDALEVTIQF